MTTVSTYVQNGTLLRGREARKAWASQVVRCACGYVGDPEHAVSGTCGGLDAQWIGCDNPRHPGQALGQPLVFRAPAQIKAIECELAKAR